MTNEVAIKQDLGLSQVAQTFAKSGYFTDARDAAQAVVKIMAGQELGIPAVAAMSGIHIVQGKPVFSSTTLAGLVKRSGRYNYKVRELTPANCAIEFFEGGESVGISEFSAADAKRAGTKNMDKYSRNMLYARAMSNGVKWYCPDVCAGPVYVPEDFEQGGTEPPPAPPTAPPEPPKQEQAPSPAEGEGEAAQALEDADFEEVPDSDGFALEPPTDLDALRDEVTRLETKADKLGIFAAPQHKTNARKKYLGAKPDAKAIGRYIDYLTAKIEDRDEQQGKQADAEASKAA